MKLVDDGTLNDNLSLLFKGPPGSGKTEAAASFAAKGPIYIAYWDKMRPVEIVTFFKKLGREDLLENVTYDVYGAKNAHEYINKLMDFTRDCRYVAVITDSVTSMTAGAVNWSMGFRSSQGPKKDKQNKDGANQFIPDFDEYKVETSFISQAIDLSRLLPTTVIWIAHPVPSIKIEGSGSSVRVTKVNPIVSYGSKVAGLIPGHFTEHYHFTKAQDWNAAGNPMSYHVHTNNIGDDYAKTAFDLPDEFDITNRLFYEVWDKLVNPKKYERKEEVVLTDSDSGEVKVESSGFVMPKWN